jgi:hypothetical protein
MRRAFRLESTMASEDVYLGVGRLQLSPDDLTRGHVKRGKQLHRDDQQFLSSVIARDDFTLFDAQPMKIVVG